MKWSPWLRYFQWSRFGLAAVVAIAFFSGCGKKEPDAKKAQNAAQPKEVSRRVAAESENAFNDATFAVQIKDYARAEASLKQALALRDDIPSWWITMGSVKKRLGKTGDAKDAYRKALAIQKRFYDDTDKPEFLIEEIYTLLLLGQEKDARQLLEKGLRRHPDDRRLKTFNDQKQIDELLKDPGVKEIRI